MLTVLTIAGSDSGGGAGIQADLKTFHRFGLFGTSVITAVTAQNTRGVAAWRAVGADLVRAQIEAVAEDLPPAAIKSGMLADADTVAVVAEGIRRFALRPYVLDPVMVASSGAPLLAEGGVRAIRDELLPLADLVTPNLDEAEILTGERVRDIAAMAHAARALVAAGARAALVKGGHLEGERATDVLFDGQDVHVVTHERIRSRHTHGTGCTVSAAITAHLALGVSLAHAVERALEYVHQAIATAPGLGQGNGPLNHFAGDGATCEGASPAQSHRAAGSGP
ncbi:MAG TPA: bifunctional hydroxymethylpyrimidine kinase/phosphomethylpyrimidine kinase [Gemmatimonadaceae bacterium]|nr:bifunctional hydroxymethylpyrimidine kinase/phosphomethylpyrimidine kinase [Gemmatimonadaceae bacterium]